MIRRFVAWLRREPPPELTIELIPCEGPDICRNCGKTLELHKGSWFHTYYSFSCIDPEPLTWE